MDFGQGNYGNRPMASYANSMDPEMYHGAPPGGAPMSGSADSRGGEISMGGGSSSVKDIGMSVPMGISAQNAAGIYSKIRMGAGAIEIGFPGKYQGQRQAMTPGMFGEDQRQAIREIAKLNEVSLTTHAAYSIMGLMGQDQRGNFSVNNATMDLEEIKSAINFAADTAGGGSVVVHTGEWERPMTDMVIDDETGGLNQNLGWDLEGNGRNMFRKRPTEIVDANFVLLDDRDSRIFEQVNKDKHVNYPVWKRAQEGHWGKDQNGHRVYIRGVEYDGDGNVSHPGDYLNYGGDKIIEQNIYDPVKGRVPEYNADEQRFEVKSRHYRYFQEEAIEYNRWLKKNYKRLHGVDWEDPKSEWYYHKKYPEESYLQATLESQEGYARGWALQFSNRVQTQIEAVEKLKEKLAFYEDLTAKTKPEDQWKLMKQDQSLMRITGDLGGIMTPESKSPVEMLKKTLKEAEANLEYERLSGYSQEQQARDTAETREHLVTPIKRFEKVTAQLYALGAMHAYRRSKDGDNPIVLNIENIFPDRFGNHPKELKWVISKVREKMVNLLTEDEIYYGENEGYPTDGKPGDKGKNPYKVEGMSVEEAQRIAESHVKATFDTAHANLWRKYWVDIPGKNPEENDAAFKNWYMDQFEDLAKNNMIGNVHLVDNLGQWDDHLAPGQGNAPIKEVMGVLKKYGYDKAITTEPGADASTDLSDFHGLMKAWRHLGSPISGSGFGAPRVPGTWGGVQYSYFGQTEAPQYIFGAYAPSNDWTLWSQVPLE